MIERAASEVRNMAKRRAFLDGDELPGRLRGEQHLADHRSDGTPCERAWSSICPYPANSTSNVEEASKLPAALVLNVRQQRAGDRPRPR